jgi:hypothetical protein
MSLKELWMLLPLASLYVCFFIGLTYIPETITRETWWAIPLLITLVVAWWASLIVAIRYSQ